MRLLPQFYCWKEEGRRPRGTQVRTMMEGLVAGEGGGPKPLAQAEPTVTRPSKRAARITEVARTVKSRSPKGR